MKIDWKAAARAFRKRWRSSDKMLEWTSDYGESLEAEVREARNEAATARRAYLHEMQRADEAVRQLHGHDPRAANRLAQAKYQRTLPEAPRFDLACTGRTYSNRPNLANVRPPEDKCLR